ncbi:MAG TPA: VOC family protein [Thermoanaerobaculia bacterium]|nr:VOC family protein [Thermoanaerobaculia bacterium]
MFGHNDAMATIAVRDLERAARFYEGTLGLRRIGEGDGPRVYESGSSRVLVYESEFAGTNRATSATWNVRENIEGLVEWLKSRGVTFEHYDLPGATHVGDLHVFGSMRGAWFKDPDGNILHIVSE